MRKWPTLMIKDFYQPSVRVQPLTPPEAKLMDLIKIHFTGNITLSPCVPQQLINLALIGCVEDSAWDSLVSQIISCSMVSAKKASMFSGLSLPHTAASVKGKQPNNVDMQMTIIHH